MKEDRQKIIQRIQKLLAMADTRNYNEHEAANATKQAQLLLTKYNLTISEVEAKEIIYIDLPAKDSEGGWQDWQLFLLRGVESAFGVKVLLMSNIDGAGKIMNRFYRYMGGPVDIETSRYTFEFLVQVIERLCGETCKEEKAREKVKEGLTPVEKALWDELAVPTNRPFFYSHEVDKESYRLGLVASLCKKLEEMKYEEEKYTDGVSLKDQGKRNAIIHIKKDALEKYLKDINLHGVVENDVSVKDPQAFQKGRQDGAGVEIRKGIN